MPFLRIDCNSSSCKTSYHTLFCILKARYSALPNDFVSAMMLPIGILKKMTQAFQSFSKCHCRQMTNFNSGPLSCALLDFVRSTVSYSPKLRYFLFAMIRHH